MDFRAKLYLGPMRESTTRKLPPSLQRHVILPLISYPPDSVDNLIPKCIPYTTCAPLRP